MYYTGKNVGQAFQPDKPNSQAGKPDLHSIAGSFFRAGVILLEPLEVVVVLRHHHDLTPTSTEDGTRLVSGLANQFGDGPGVAGQDDLFSGSQPLDEFGELGLGLFDG
jgi:hypothetical protein